jgi:hypothetical protein
MSRETVIFHLIASVLLCNSAISQGLDSEDRPPDSERPPLPLESCPATSEMQKPLQSPLEDKNLDP